MKYKIFRISPKSPPKGRQRLYEEFFNDYSPLMDFISQIGESRIYHFGTFGDTVISYCTIFYEADGLLICPTCKWEYSPDHAFCGHCGKALVPIAEPDLPACVHCGKPLLPTSDFCTACGQRQPEQPKRKGLFD